MIDPLLFGIYVTFIWYCTVLYAHSHAITLNSYNAFPLSTPLPSFIHSSSFGLSFSPSFTSTFSVSPSLVLLAKAAISSS